MRRRQVLKRIATAVLSAMLNSHHVSMIIKLVQYFLQLASPPPISSTIPATTALLATRGRTTVLEIAHRLRSDLDRGVGGALVVEGAEARRLTRRAGVDCL